jgi:hypothetical protein
LSMLSKRGLLQEISFGIRTAVSHTNKKEERL